MNPSLVRPMLLAGLAALLLLPSAAFAGLTVDTTVAKPDVRFAANGEPGALDIDARTTDGTLADDGTNVVFAVPLANVKTGIELRDEHMKSKFLHVDQHPNVSLSVAKASLTFPTEVGKKTSGTADAQFTVMDVAKPTKVKWEIAKTKTGYKLSGSFGFDISQHGVEIPSYLGVTVDAKMTAKAVFYAADTP